MDPVSLINAPSRLPLDRWRTAGADHEWMAYEHTTEQSGSEPLQPGNCGHHPNAFVGNLIPICLGMFSGSDIGEAVKDAREMAVVSLVCRSRVPPTGPPQYNYTSLNTLHQLCQQYMFMNR